MSNPGMPHTGATSTDPAAALPVPKTKRGERTRLRIIEAAEREIGTKGFSEASIATITSEADVAQGTFYLYFRTKEDVLREIVLGLGRKLRGHLTAAVAGARDRLEIERLGIHSFLQFVRDNPNLYRVVAESQFVDAAVHRAYYEEFAAGYRLGLDQARQRGEISEGDNEVRAWALMGVTDMVGYRFALHDQTNSLERVAAAAYDFVAHGIAPRAKR